MYWNPLVFCMLSFKVVAVIIWEAPYAHKYTSVYINGRLEVIRGK